MNATRLFAVAFVLLSQSALAAQLEPPPGAAACSGCHTFFSDVKTSIPRVHGRKAADIIAAMADFRTGKRAATVMDRIAKGFTEEETEVIAAWLAAQKEERANAQHR